MSLRTTSGASIHELRSHAPAAFAASKQDTAAKGNNQVRFRMAFRRRSTSTLALILVLFLSGCSVRRMAIKSFSDTVASGGATFSSDNDPELIRQAVPFSLKLMESLLDEVPRHRSLLLATSKRFTQYT